MDASEKLLTLREAAQLVPGAPSVSTLWRWIMRAERSLEATKVGGRFFTTEAAIARFIKGCNESRPSKVNADKAPERRREPAGVLGK